MQLNGVTTSYITSASERKGAYGLRSHGIIVFFMCLGVLPIPILTLLTIVDTLICDEHPWAYGCRDTPGCWKRIQLEHC